MDRTISGRAKQSGFVRFVLSVVLTLTTAAILSGIAFAVSVTSRVACAETKIGNQEKVMERLEHKIDRLLERNSSTP